MQKHLKADHIGSFLRPADLLLARQSAPPEELRAIEDRHIHQVLAKQAELGFEFATDGELRRRNFMSDFTDAVEGFDLADALTNRRITGLVLGDLEAEELSESRRSMAHLCPSAGRFVIDSQLTPSVRRLDGLLRKRRFASYH